MQTREERICENLGLVHACANRFRNKGIDYDDLYSAGCIGLVKAADGFKEELGFAFSTYAVPAILGEIRRLFRDDGAVKISRSLKEQARKLAVVQEALEKELDREPTISELASRMGISEFEAAELLNVSKPVTSLTEMYEDAQQKEQDIPVEEGEDLENRLAISEVLDKLKQEDRRLIELRYFRGLTQTKTAELMGLSQVQVSRYERRILLEMRRRLTG